jgi:hypothetical protein
MKRNSTPSIEFQCHKPLVKAYFKIMNSSYVKVFSYASAHRHTRRKPKLEFHIQNIDKSWDWMVKITFALPRFKSTLPIMGPSRELLWTGVSRRGLFEFHKRHKISWRGERLALPWLDFKIKLIHYVQCFAAKVDLAGTLGILQPSPLKTSSVSNTWIIRLAVLSLAVKWSLAMYSSKGQAALHSV